MTDDKLDFLDEVKDDAEDAQPVQAEPKEAKEAEPVREHKGEKEAAPPAAEEENDATDEEPKVESDSKSVPVVALLDEREKRQQYQRQFEDANKELEALRKQYQQSQMPKEKAPDFYEDPDKAFQHYTTQLQQQQVAEKLKSSKFYAEREYGAELVSEAFEYFNQHPQESQALLNEPSPFHAAVEHYKKQKFLTEVNDPEEWRKQERERIRQELMAEVTQPSKPNAPPPSMANATAAGKDAIPQGGAFDQLFPD